MVSFDPVTDTHGEAVTVVAVLVRCHVHAVPFERL